MTPPFKIRAIGEIAIRCTDIKAMAEFYETILGLEQLTGGYRDGIRFFKIAEGFAGHTTVLALFQAEQPPATGDASSLHHIALTVRFEDQDAAMDWFRAQDIPYTVEQFGWIGWRGVFVKDPEGNTVELVAYDHSQKTAPDSADHADR